MPWEPWDEAKLGAWSAIAAESEAAVSTDLLGEASLLPRAAAAGVRGRSEPPPARREAAQPPPPDSAWANFQGLTYGGHGSGLASREEAERRRQKLDFFAERRGVMASQLVSYLVCGGGVDGTYVDATFGSGGHSVELLTRLSAAGRVVAFDVDPRCEAMARALEQKDERFTFHLRPMGELSALLAGQTLGGVLIDVGVQTAGADEDGALDLRLNKRFGQPAHAWLRTVTVNQLAWVLHEYGEDTDVVLCHRLAEAILHRQRHYGPYRSVRELTEVCKEVKHFDDRGMPPPKLTLQALRCFLNHEQDQLDLALRGSMELLKAKGRVVVITYKRKEHGHVKRFLREHEEDTLDKRRFSFVRQERLVELFPLLGSRAEWAVSQLCSPEKPSREEADQNPKARAATAHVLQKEVRDFGASPELLGGGARALGEQFATPRPVAFVGSDPKQPVVVGDALSRARRAAPWDCQRCSATQWARRISCRGCGFPR